MWVEYSNLEQMFRHYNLVIELKPEHSSSEFDPDQYGSVLMLAVSHWLCRGDVWPWNDQAKTTVLSESPLKFHY